MQVLSSVPCLPSTYSTRWREAESYRESTAFNLVRHGHTEQEKQLDKGKFEAATMFRAADLICKYKIFFSRFGIQAPC
jgi:hypothetical protein